MGGELFGPAAVSVHTTFLCILLLCPYYFLDLHSVMIARAERPLFPVEVVTNVSALLLNICYFLHTTYGLLLSTYYFLLTTYYLLPVAVVTNVSAPFSTTHGGGPPVGSK